MVQLFRDHFWCSWCHSYQIRISAAYILMPYISTQKSGFSCYLNRMNTLYTTAECIMVNTTYCWKVTTIAVFVLWLDHKNLNYCSEYMKAQEQLQLINQQDILFLTLWTGHYSFQQNLFFILYQSVFSVMNVSGQLHLLSAGLQIIILES